MFFDFLFRQNCVIEMTCFPDQPMDVWRLYHEFYGIPNAVTLGLLLGIIGGAIVLHTRSLAHLAIIAVYIISMVSATFLADAYVAPQYHTVLYIVALSIASLVVIMVLKVLRE